ncbi:MAG TPA: hypothetical protein VF842_00910 [Flavobacterium sp.]
MKKITLFIGILSILAIVSCKKKEDKPFPPQVETSNAKTTSTPAVSGEVKDSTSIKVGTDGVNVTTKDGATKTSVNVSGGEAKIEIKK